MSQAAGIRLYECLNIRICIKTNAPEKRIYLPSAIFFPVRVMPQSCIFFVMSLSSLLRHIHDHCTSAPITLYLYINYYVMLGAVSGAVVVQCGAVVVQFLPVVQ